MQQPRGAGARPPAAAAAAAGAAPPLRLLRFTTQQQQQKQQTGHALPPCEQPAPRGLEQQARQWPPAPAARSLAAEAEAMSARGLAAACARLLRLHGRAPAGTRELERAASRGDDARLWQQLLQHAQRLAGELAPQQASLLLYACAKLRRPPPGELVSALLQQPLAPQQLAALPPAGATNVLWALAVLACTPSEAWTCAYYAATAPALGAAADDTAAAAAGGAAAAPAAGGFNHHQLVQMLWAMGRLRQRPPAAWLHALLAALQPALPRLSASELANVLWGLAQLGYRPSTKWLGCWFRASAAALPASGPDELACMAASAGLLRLELRHGAWLVALRARLAALSAPGEAGVGRLQARHIASVLCGLAKRRSPQPPHWLAVLLDWQLAAAAAGRAAPRDLAATLWALPPLLHPTASAWAAQPQNAARLKQLAALLLPLLPACTAGELVQLAVGFAGLAFFPGANWLKHHEHAMARHRLHLSDANRLRLRAATAWMWNDG